MRGQAGFTLLELLLVLGIFTLVFGSVFQIMQRGQMSWFIADAEVELQQQLRIGMDKITRELSQASSANLSINAAQDGVTFAIPSGYNAGAIVWGSSIQYSRGGTNNQQLLRTSNAETTVLVNHITNAVFTQPTAGVLSIDLTVGKNAATGHAVSKTLSSQVNLRND